MHQPRERRDQKQRQPENDVQLEDPVHFRELGRCGRVEDHDGVGPAHQLDHLFAVELLRRPPDGGDAQHQLHPEQRQHCDVSERGAAPDTRIGQPAMQKQRRADQCRRSGDASYDHCRQLLEHMRHAHGLDHPERGQKADEMPDEQHQHAKVEQVGPDHHLPPPQELAGLRSPTVLVGVKAQDAPNDQDGNRQIRVPAKR